MALGLLLGAAIAEGAFHLRDHGAFPHLNVYDPDHELAVRLRPGAQQKIAFGGNPPTSIHIGKDGLRGELPPLATANDELLVVGDSQVFGLGVEEGETFSARLAERLHRTVVNAGIPTYGPLEYQAVLTEWVTKRRTQTVIYVVNLANDLVEAKRPNSTRHAVWDGWAVRKETAPDHVTSFPGRALLFRESHAVFAFRRLLHGSSEADAQPLPSEGSWHDLLDAAKDNDKARDAAQQQGLDDWVSAMNDASSQVDASQAKLEKLGGATYPGAFNHPGAREYLAKHGHPGDIVSEQVQFSEASEGPDKSVLVVLKGAKIREEIEAQLRATAEADIEREEAKAILASFDERAAHEARIAELRERPEKLIRAHSPMTKPFELALAQCKTNGARLVVVVLPMDVQVSATEWQKYGQATIDMAPAQILVDDVVHVAEALGITVLDAKKALAAAEPDAFLKADLHMSAKGHRALAEAIAAKLAEPPPEPKLVATGPALGYTKVCACQKQLHPEAGCGPLPARPSLDCLRSFSADCEKLLACATSTRGKPLAGGTPQ